MKKNIYFATMIFSLIMLISNVFAFVDVTKTEQSEGETLNTYSFINYPPFGSIVYGQTFSQLESVFLEELEKFAKERKYFISPYAVSDNYIDNIRAIRSGEIDLIIGCYYATKMYSGIDFVFPAVISNPIHAVMMPDRINEANTVENLKHLKGIRVKTEIFSDFVENALKEFNLQTVDNLDEAYEKIFVGDADYIIGGYYYMLISAIKSGVRPYVSFSRQPLWNIPVFIGISKMTRVDKKLLMKLLTAWSNSKQVKDNIHKKIQDTINALEVEYEGTVPPMYVRKDNSLTASGKSVDNVSNNKIDELNIEKEGE